MIFSRRSNPDEECRHDGNGNQLPAPSLARAWGVASIAVGVIRRHGEGTKAFEAVRRHIVGMDLTPDRINRMRTVALEEVKPYGRRNGPVQHPDDQLVSDWYYKGAGQCTWAEWRRANHLVMRVTLRLLLDVPLRCQSDFQEFVDIVSHWPGVLPKTLQQKVLNRIQPFLAARVTGGKFRIDSTFTFRGRKPWKGYRPNDLLRLEPVTGRITKGDYILEGRTVGAQCLMRIEEVHRRHFVTYLPGFWGAGPIKRKEWIVRYRVTNRFPMRQEEAVQ